jgi:hypothetical protein
VTIYSVAEEGQVKRLEEAGYQWCDRYGQQRRQTILVSTYDIDRILANRAGLFWLITHPSLRPFAPKSCSLTVSSRMY